MTGPAKEAPKVTIGIPTRNRAEYVARAIRSALAQTYENIEVVISDNASADNTVRAIEEIRDPRIVLIKQSTNIGMVGNFNACLNGARGELFLMLSDDDILEAVAIEELSRPFHDGVDGSAPASIGLVWCPCTVLDAGGRKLWVTEGGPETEPALSLIAGLFNGRRGPRFCSVMTRTADLLAVGGYNEARHGAISDCGAWTRVAIRYPSVVCVNRPLANYTLHGGSVTIGSTCQDWLVWGENIYEDLAKELQTRGDASGAKLLKRANRNHVSNLVVTILLQFIGKPGWIARVWREGWQVRRYLFTPFVARRLLRDGWKIGRMRRRI